MKIKAHTLFHLADTRKSFLQFWLVLIAVFFVTVVLKVGFSLEGFNLGIQEYRHNTYYSSMVASCLIAIPIYLIVAALNLIPDSFPHVLAMGATRRAFYMGSVLYYAILALAMTTILNFGFFIEGYLYLVLGWNHLAITAILEGLEMPGLISFSWIFFGFQFVVLGFFNLVSAIFYKTNHNLFKAFLALAFILSFVNATIREGWMRLFFWVFINNSWIEIGAKLIFLGGLLLLVAWPIVRRTEVKY